jgi:hypothetical protein
MKLHPSSRLHRVNRSVPCPICQRPDWCMVSAHGDLAVCCRSESEHPAPPFQGWIHSVPPRQRPLPEHVRRASAPQVPHELRDFADLLARDIECFDAKRRSMVAESLGLEPCAFEQYPLGFRPSMNALAVPSMRCEAPRICGIRLRRIPPAAHGPKWSCERGSTAGLLLPHCPPSATSPIILCEGPSDTLACAQLGLHAVGRWSCGLDPLSLETLAHHVRDIERPTILVFGDNDGERETGKRGADAAASAVVERLTGAVVRRAQPPAGVKDLRAWVIEGATAADVLDAGGEVRRGS